MRNNFNRDKCCIFNADSCIIFIDSKFKAIDFNSKNVNWKNVQLKFNKLQNKIYAVKKTVVIL